MKHFDLPLVLDSLFYGTAAGALALGLLRFYRVPLAVTLTAAALLALAAGCAVALLEYGRHKKRSLGKAEREQREKLLLHLALEREERVRCALLEAYRKDGKDVRCEQDGLTADGERLVPLFTMQPLSADAVAGLLRKFGSEPFTLVCNALTPEAERLLASFGRRAVRGEEVYELFRRADAFPSPLICGEIPRPGLKMKARRAFSKRNARPFFVCGILLLAMSLFSFFPVYYVITGGVLLIAAVFIRFLGYA